MYRKKLKFVVILVLAAALAAAVFFWKSVEEYKFTELCFYPVLESRYEIGAGDTAVLDEDTGIATISLAGGTQIESTDLCAFSHQREAVILTRSMAFFPEPVGDTLKCYKLSAFTDVESDGENVRIRKNGRDEVVRGLFLFNGNNSYVLLSSAVLSFGDSSIPLSPLSYVIACTDQWVQYYDRSSDSYQIVYLEPGTRVDVSFGSCDFIIHADLDRAESSLGEYMFVSSVDYLEDYLQ